MPTLATGAPLARRYPSFPEEPSPFVNVLCEGPSIQRVTKADLLPGPVVAINHALALSRKFAIDFWATIDDPNLLWDWSKPHRPKGLKIFSTDNNIGFYEKLCQKDHYQAELYVWWPTYMEHHRNGENKPPVLPTIMPVLAWLARLEPVRHVRIFGCDMTGQNSPLSELPYTAEEDIGWEYRWVTERKLISLAIKKYRASGKRLERWDQAPHVSRNLLSSWSRMRQPAHS